MLPGGGSFRYGPHASCPLPAWLTEPHALLLAVELLWLAGPPLFVYFQFRLLGTPIDQVRCRGAAKIRYLR